MFDFYNFSEFINFWNMMRKIPPARRTEYPNVYIIGVSLYFPILLFEYLSGVPPWFEAVSKLH